MWYTVLSAAAFGATLVMLITLVVLLVSLEAKYANLSPQLP